MTAFGPNAHRSARSVGWSLFVVVVVIVVFQGFSIIDTDIPEVWRAMSGTPFAGDPQRLYLAEGLLPNFVGLSLLHLHWGDRVTLIGWWLLGLASLVVAIVHSVRSGSLTVTQVFVVVTFTRLIDTLSMWVGRSDPFLLAFLVLSVNDRKVISRSAIALAALCHPSAAILASAGSFSVETSLKSRSDFIPVFIAVAVASSDVAMAHWLVPGLVDRTGFLVSQFHTVLRSGIECGLVTLVSAFVFPVLCIYTLGRDDGEPPSFARYFYLAVWLAIVAVIACLLSLDHTRVACLLTLAPLLTFMKVTRYDSPAARVASNGTFLLLATARIVIPHVAGDGFFLFNWGIVLRFLRL